MRRRITLAILGLMLAAAGATIAAVAEPEPPPADAARTFAYGYLTGNYRIVNGYHQAQVKFRDSTNKGTDQPICPQYRHGGYWNNGQCGTSTGWKTVWLRGWKRNAPIYSVRLTDGFNTKRLGVAWQD